MLENKYPYDNWKSITESDFVTLFIKTWFAFVSTLREMYPAEIPYYQATGDSRYISPYKREFPQNIAYRLNYADIKYHLYEVYKHGMKIIADRYPRFIVDDFYSLNLSFKETASEEFSLEGGFSGKFVCTAKCASAETLTATIMCTDKLYRTKVDKNYAPIDVSVDYSAILMAIVQEIEDRQFVLAEASLIEHFYEKLFDAISDAFFSKINSAKSSIPEKGNKRFLKVFDAMLAFCARALNAMKVSCLNPQFGAEHKLLSQMPITNFLQSIEDGEEMTLADKEKASAPLPANMAKMYAKRISSVQLCWRKEPCSICVWCSFALQTTKMRSVMRWEQKEVQRLRKNLPPREERCKSPKTVWLNWTSCSSVFMRTWSTGSCPKLVFRCYLMIMSRSRQT